ncbi:hypothetical protein CTZ35_25525 [Escherichia coli]|nr:hypothetical protein CTZ35_25525 [Escherichia coli]
MPWVHGPGLPVMDVTNMPAEPLVFQSGTKSAGLELVDIYLWIFKRKRLVRTVLIFTESSDQLSRATDRVPGLPASPGYVQ